MVTYSAKNVNDKTSIRLSALCSTIKLLPKLRRTVIEEPKTNTGVCCSQNCVLAFFRIANIKITLRIVQNDIERLYNL